MNGEGGEKTCMMWNGEKERENMAAIVVAADPAWYSADLGPRDVIFRDVISRDIISCDVISRDIISCDVSPPFRDVIPRRPLTYRDGGVNYRFVYPWVKIGPLFLRWRR